MSATIIERQETSVTIQITIPLTRSMLDTEEAIQQILNQAGVLAGADVRSRSSFCGCSRQRNREGCDGGTAGE